MCIFVFLPMHMIFPASHCQLKKKSFIIEQIIPPHVWLWESAWGETVLMFRLQMTETSNPKHGYVVEIHAFVRCQPMGTLTDDAPDSSALLFTPYHLLHNHFQTPTDLNPPAPPKNMGVNHGNTQPDYSLHTVIEYVTNTLRIALGNQIKTWIIYKDMVCLSDRAGKVREYTYNIA